MVTNFENYFKRNFGPGTFIVFHEKDGDRYFDTATRDNVLKIALYIVAQRVEEGWYEYDDDELNLLDVAKKAVKDKDGAAAFAILREDKDGEYCDFSVETFEEVK